jgi:dihydrofolate reductase
MRKVIMFNSVSLDGYYAGPNGEIDWFTHDPEVDNAAHQMMTPDTIIFGKSTYQMFEGYWPLLRGIQMPKQQNGGDITIFGSGTIVQQLKV